MERSFLFFINPISGTGNKKDLRALISREMQSASLRWQVMETRADADYRFLPAFINENQISDVVICGGDGTVSAIAGHLRNIDVNIAIIPMGSGNGLALAARIPKNAKKALKLLSSGTAGYIDGFLINGKFSCMLCGIGFDAQVAHNFAKQKKRGLSTYVQEVIKAFLSARAYQLSIIVKGRELQFDTFFLTVSNSNQFGNHFTIAPAASLTDGLLDIVVVRKMNRLRLLYAVLRQIYRGRPGSIEEIDIIKSRVHYFQAESLIIHNPESAPLHIDGEPVESEKVLEIKLIKNAFRLMRPG